MPVNGEPIIIVRIPKKICNPLEPTDKLDLIVMIKSCIYCFSKRSYARETYMKLELWRDLKVQFVFVVGLPTPNETDIYHFEGVNVNLYRDALKLSKIYANSRWLAAKKLENESKVYQDMLIGSFYDTYFNLTLKLMSTYRWAATFCDQKTPLYIFIDDDYVLLPNNTINLVRKLNASFIKSIIGGPVHPSSIVARPSKDYFHLKWAVSEREYPWERYPPYFYGTGYILSSTIVNDASLAMAFTQNIRIDDSYLGIVLSRLNKTLTDMKEFRIDAEEKQIESGAVVIHTDVAEDIIDWGTGQIKKT
ncbi:unnamed protein product [Trichobilharzia regenti]|nr:unnamed protein product [Trichobilharzia regenti]